MNKILRASRKFPDTIALAAFLVILIQMFGSAVDSAIEFIVPVRYLFDMITHDPDVTVFLMRYAEFAGIWVVFFLFCLIFRANRPMLAASLHNERGNKWLAIPIGILIGGCMNGLCVLFSYLHGDIKLSFNELNPVLFLVFFICVAIQSGAEEILCRCYLYQKLRRRYRHPAVAIIGSSLLFMALHLGNPGVTRLGLIQVFAIGVLCSVIVYYYDSLWTAIWIHAAWNFSQSIVFGLPNSGIVSKYSVFRLEAATARDGFFYNTSFGVEGSAGANVIIIAVLLIILIRGIVSKRGECMDYWAKMEEENKDRHHKVEIFGLIALYLFIGWQVWLVAANPMNIDYEQIMQEAQKEAGVLPAGEEQEAAEPAEGEQAD